MSTTAHTGIADYQDSFDAYCSRHRVTPESALAELVTMALGLPADIQDYLREQKDVRRAVA